jgi:hypothetical protein
VNFTRILARRAAVATLAVLAVLASMVVTASPASAIVTAPNATLSSEVLYRGEPFTISYGDILCDGAPADFARISVGVAGAGQTSIYAGITTESSLHVPSHAPIGTNSVVGVVSSGPCTGQVIHFVTFEVIPMEIDVTVAADAAMYRPTDTATITATIAATGNPGMSLDGYTAQFLRGGQLIGTAPISGGSAVLADAAVGEPGWHHLQVRIADWELGTLDAAPYEVVAIPVTLTASGPETVAAGAPATFTITATSPEGTPNLAGLTATLDGTPVAVDVAGTTAAVNAAAGQLSIGAHTLAVTLPATGDFDTASTTFDVQVDPHGATLHATIAGPVTYGAPFDIDVQATSAADEPLDGTVSATVASEVLTAPVAADGTATISVPADVAAQVHAGSHTFDVTYDGGSSHRAETTTATTTIGVAPTRIEITAKPVAGVPGSATITVTAEHGTPDGFVSFELDGGGFGAAIPLTGGRATVAIPALPGGTHTMNAIYWGAGGTRYDSAENTTLVRFTHAATTTSVVVHGMSPATSRTSSWDARVCTNIVDPAVTVTPVDGTAIEVVVHRDGSLFDEFTVPATNRAACFGTAAFTSAYPVGEYTLTTTFPGDAYLAASGGTATFTVEHATTELSLAVDAATATPRAGTELTATLSSPVADRTHTGSVTLFVNGDPVDDAAVDPSTNIATFAVPLDAGAADVTATYSGDDYHRATSSTIHLHIDQLLADVGVTVTPPMVVVGDVATFRATVTPYPSPPGLVGVTRPSGVLSTRAAAGAATPTGTVTFLVDGSPVGTATLIDGVATLDHRFTAAGSYVVTATYSGDANTAPGAATDVATAPTATALAAPAAASPSSPLEVIPAPDAAPASPAAAEAGSNDRASGVANMAHTGSDASTLLSLAAVLLSAGIAVVAADRRRRRRLG